MIVAKHLHKILSKLYHITIGVFIQLRIFDFVYSRCHKKDLYQYCMYVCMYVYLDPCASDGGEGFFQVPSPPLPPHP